ncbi:divergent polysaccharide deacetylase family protein [Halocynthiibacter namhaensis]|uniref:divergent polysaccharide deacetylase family protein n=1 Tax=Halocynthiibacter namhaensis TaxID=1290553 RepID=UPI000690E7B5|nr:divergent polysaccharide deacetylase family protein [Halocynthiibacter namhaensis]
MARGILTGMVAGALVGGTGLAVLSLQTDLPNPALTPELSEVEIDVVANVDPIVAEVIVPDVDEAIDPTIGTADAEAPTANSTDVITDTDDAPDDEMPAENSIEENEVAVVDPESEDITQIADTVVVDTSPEVITQSPFVAPVDGASISEDAVVPGQDKAVDVASPADAPNIAETIPPEVAIAEAEVQVDVETASEQGPGEAEFNTAETITTESATTDPVTTDANEGQDSSATASATSIGTAVGSGFGTANVGLTDQGGGSRLATIGATQESDLAQQGTSESAVERAPHALTDNASVFERPVGKALIAVILVDSGSEENSAIRDKIHTLPFPVSIAVDAANPQAGEDAARLRENGFEVLVQLALPRGAVPSDVETGFLSVRTSIPDAVAVLDDADRTIGSDRNIATQLSEALVESGHGLVLYDKGLNTAGQLASRQGVPNSRVFRVLDDQGQNASTIRRMLVRAEFKAQQDGAVVLVGNLRDETLTALQEWALDDRGSNVVLAPISAVLVQP